jgi:hypothetical protein
VRRNDRETQNRSRSPPSGRKAALRFVRLDGLLDRRVRCNDPSTNLGDLIQQAGDRSIALRSFQVSSSSSCSRYLLAMRWRQATTLSIVGDRVRNGPLATRTSRPLASLIASSTGFSPLSTDRVSNSRVSKRTNRWRAET